MGSEEGMNRRVLASSLAPVLERLLGQQRAAISGNRRDGLSAPDLSAQEFRKLVLHKTAARIWLVS